jgi:hypothetical protein
MSIGLVLISGVRDLRSLFVLGFVFSCFFLSAHYSYISIFCYAICFEEMDSLSMG